MDSRDHIFQTINNQNNGSIKINNMNKEQIDEAINMLEQQLKNQARERNDPLRKEPSEVKKSYVKKHSAQEIRKNVGGPEQKTLQDLKDAYDFAQRKNAGEDKLNQYKNVKRMLKMVGNPPTLNQDDNFLFFLGNNYHLVENAHVKVYTTI